MKYEVTKRYRSGQFAGVAACTRQISGKLVKSIDDAKQTFAARCGVTLETLELSWVLEVRELDNEQPTAKRSLVVNWLGRAQCTR